MTISGISRAHQVLDGLLKDNADYVNGLSVPQSQLSSETVRHQLAMNGQAPVVAMVACADSRVGPEIIFGAGIGKLFVIRNAGNIVSERSVQASLEFAVNHLKVPLVMVIGHSKCGAITAATNVAKQASHSSAKRTKTTAEEENESDDSDDTTITTPLGEFVTDLAHVVKHDIGAKQEVPSAIHTNVRHGVSSLKFNHGPIADAYASGTIDIVGAVYDIHSGKVSLVDE